MLVSHTIEIPTDAHSAPGSALWRDAVVYQVYLRSYRDSDGDGIGDLGGLREGLEAIAALGCDAIWLNPCYASPQRDHGYDIADYLSIDPAYGTMADFDAVVKRAHDLGLRVLMDMVANHCSVDHAWFRAAVAAGRGSTERARFLFREGRGVDGELPPNNWDSVFGGLAWTRVVEPDGSPGQWYLHSFDSSQPDFDWRHPDVAEHFARVLRFWFDRGVDGFRIDVAHGHYKAADLADHPGGRGPEAGHNHAMWDQPEVHDIYRSWREIGREYEPEKYFVGEIWVPSPDRLADYLRPDELHNAFSFDLLVQPWEAARFRRAIDTGLTVGRGWPAWTLANHDVHRAVTRYGQEQPSDEALPTDMIAAARRTGPANLERGRRRARAATALALALPGSMYLYQGEELGLPEVFDLPDAARQDPIWTRSNGAELGRDGCRIPLPWTTDGDTFGFGATGSRHAWLPQPAWFGAYARETQAADPGSMLSLYRDLLAARRAHLGGAAALRWLPTARDSLLAFERGAFLCATNFSGEPLAVLPQWHNLTVLVSTQPLVDPAVIPPESTVWFVDERLAAS
ncbi:alpha-amylase family glycosyl hydrolase [Microbacterium sp. P06]|uniref:glycoside hydrolase family 13 protein n=1 Tax=Microbacterium sp. P06 TaxID=3366949 RepID=UPI003746CC5F